MNFSLTIQQITDIVGGTVLGLTATPICGINSLETAGPTDISFLASKRFEKFIATTQAGCVLVTPDFDIKSLGVERSFIRVANPQRSIVELIRHIQSSTRRISGSIHQTAVISSTAEVALTATIECNVVVGSGSAIGEHVVIGCNSVIGENVRIGDESIIASNVTILDDSVIGCRCVIHAGTVIGSDGFGYLQDSTGHYEKIPQIGNVVLGNDVEVGANTCIDRATLGSTTIGNGVKIDNLVHIAHNVTIAENSAIAAQSGIAGSATLGARNRIAGQVGIVGHIEIADDVTIGAQSGVSKPISTPGQYSGSPAVPLMTRLKSEARLRNIHQLFEDVERLKVALNLLQSES